MNKTAKEMFAELGFLENCNTKDEQLVMYVIKMLKGEE